MKNIRPLAYLALMFCSATYAGNEGCPFPDIYIEIDQSYHECVHGDARKGASCDLFLKDLKQLLPKYDCKRSFDTGPVPALWLFGAADEDYIKLLYELASGSNSMYTDNWFANETARAKAIFLSEEFRAVLDGTMAEEYYPLVEKLRNNAP